MLQADFLDANRVFVVLGDAVKIHAVRAGDANVGFEINHDLQGH